MKEPLLEELEIVAFDGRPRGFCASVLPVVRWRNQNLYAKISTEEPLSAPKAWHNADEFQTLCDQGHVTRLPEPAGKMFEGAALAYLSNELLMNTSVAGIELDARCRWDLEGTEHSGYIVLGAHIGEISDFLDSIAQDLRRSVEKSLRSSLAQQDSESLATAKYLLDMAFAAAQSPPFRKRLYLLFGIIRIQTFDSDTPHSVHELLVRKEFPEWSWEDYLNDIFAYKLSLQKESEFAQQAARIPPIQPNQIPHRMPRPVTVTFQAMMSDSPARRAEPQWLADNCRILYRGDRKSNQYEAIPVIIV